MKILLVESSKLQRKLFSDIFYEYSADITLSDTAGDALDIIGDGESFDFICSSVTLSDMPGYELCRILRANEATISMPIIMVTTGDYEVVERCLAAGATDVFNKNNIDSLRNYVKRFDRELRRKSDGNWSILYVEDNLTTAYQVLDWFSELAMQCDHFETAEDALESYKRNEYDVLITDVLLKGQATGLRLARQIREEHNDFDLPILIVSGFSDVSRILEVYRAGADDYVSKPITKHELIAKVSHLIDKHSAKMYAKI